MDFKLEVVVLPVADVDRTKGFYEQLGWRLDADPDGSGWLLQEIKTRLPGR
jgi:catechol 2,3-dioxygenase-like lactoylglutathione lyase family enzyme